MTVRPLIRSQERVTREDAKIVQSLKPRLPHVEIWLTQTDGRHAALAEAMRMGADGLLDDEGLHRIASTLVQEPRAGELPAASAPRWDQEAAAEQPGSRDETSSGEPVLTADELRALL